MLPGIPKGFMTIQGGSQLNLQILLIVSQALPLISMTLSKLYDRSQLSHCVCMLRCFSRVQLCPIPWTGLWPARLLCPWAFSRQEYWSGLPGPPPGDLPDSGIKPTSLHQQAGRQVPYHWCHLESPSPVSRHINTGVRGLLFSDRYTVVLLENQSSKSIGPAISSYSLFLLWSICSPISMAIVSYLSFFLTLWLHLTSNAPEKKKPS